MTTTEEETEVLYTYEEYLLEHYFGEGDPMEAFRHYLYNQHEEQSKLNEDDWGSLFSDFEDAYVGCMPFKDYVEEAFSEMNEIPDHLVYYIDYERVARDWELSGDFWTASDGMGNDYIFRSY
jgi:antirestriction protein